MGRGRAPCCDKSKVKRGPWSPTEDLRLINFIQKNGHSNWRSLPKEAGLLRCGKSCRLRWINYLSPDVKRGNFTSQEEQTIINLHNSIGNKWSKIASYLPGRTDNEIKNVWNTHLKKRLTSKVIEDSRKNEAGESKMDHSSASPSCTTSSITTYGYEIVRESNKNPEFLKVKSMHPSDGELKETASSYEPNLSHPNQFDNDVLRPNEKSGFSKSEVNGGEMEIQFDSDVDDFWELLDSLDPLQSTTTELQNGGSTKNFNNFDSEVEHGKWLRFLENELGLSTSDTDHHVRKEVQGQEFNLETEISPDLDYFPIWSA